MSPVHTGWTGRLRSLVAPLVLAALLAPASARAGDLTRLVRLKISAGDLLTGEAAVEEYRRSKGLDAEALDAVGWLARGALLLGRPDRAAAHVAELRAAIPAETKEVVVPLGAAVEVAGKLLLAREGRGAALRFLEGELARAEDPALRSRIQKNVNLLSLEGQPAPEIGGTGPAGDPAPSLASLRGRPVLVYLWAAGCGDCKAQAPVLARVFSRYRDRGLAMVAPTRLYGDGPGGKALPPAEELAEVSRAWGALEGLSGVGVPVDTETMVRYGASATPTIVLVDRKGAVRFYTPTRVSESELSRRVEELLAEPS